MNEKEIEEVNKALLKLAEHFDSVLILCTVNAEGFTRLINRRAGNYYASKGAAQEFLDDEKNKELAEYIKTTED